MVNEKSTTRHCRRCGRFVPTAFLYRDRVCDGCHSKMCADGGLVAADATVEIYGQPARVTNSYRFRKAYTTRQERGQRLALAGAVQLLDDGIYFVESASAMLEGIRGQGYHVNTRKHTCTCLDYQQHSNDALFEGCQHEWAIKAVQAGPVNPAVA